MLDSLVWAPISVLLYSSSELQKLSSPAVMKHDSRSNAVQHLLCNVNPFVVQLAAQMGLIRAPR